MTETRNMNKLVGKDFITVGIFGLIFAIVQFATAFITGMTPVGFLFYAAVAAFPCGIIYIYIIAKVPKKGAMAITLTIVSLIYFLIGTYGLVTPLFGLCGGIIAELIISSGKYRKFWRNVIAFIIYMTAQWLGFMYPMIFTTKQYIKNSMAAGMPMDYLKPMIDFITGSGFYVAVLATIIASILGALLGKKVLKKHFEKSGVL